MNKRCICSIYSQDQSYNHRFLTVSTDFHDLWYRLLKYCPKNKIPPHSANIHRKLDSVNLQICGKQKKNIQLVSLSPPLMAEWLGHSSQAHEMYCHDPEFMGLNPVWLELGVLNTSVSVVLKPKIYLLIEPFCGVNCG